MSKSKKEESYRKRTTATLNQIASQEDRPIEDKKLYLKICKTFNLLLMDAMIDTGRAFFLPKGIGWLSIIKRSSKRRLPAPKFEALWKGEPMTRHKNRHSDNFYAKFTWFRGRFFPREGELYRFQPSRENARKLAKNIKVNNTINKYIQHVSN